MSAEPHTNNEGGLRIFRNFGCLAVGKFTGDGFTFLFFVLVSRTFGQEGLGLYSFAMALTGLLAVFSDCGLYRLSVKEMSRLGTGFMVYYSRVFVLRLLLCTAVMLFMVFFAWALRFPLEVTLVVLLVGAYQIFMTVVNGFGAVFVAREEMHVTSLLDISLRISTALAGILVILAGGGLAPAVAVMPVVAGLHVLVGHHLAARRYGRAKARNPLRGALGTLRNAFPYALHALLGELLFRSPVILLGFILGAASAGVFNAAHRVILFLMFVGVFAALSLFPVASRYYLTSPEAYKNLYHQAMAGTIVVALPAAAGLWLVAPDLMHLVYGAEFAESAGVMRILAGLLVTIPLKIMLETFLTAADRQQTVTRVYFWAAMAAVPVFLVAIRYFGVNGAAAVLLCWEVLLVVFFMVQLKSLAGLPRMGTRAVMSATGVAAFMALLYPGRESIGLGLTVVAAVVIYTCVMLLFRDIRRKELTLILCVAREGRGMLKSLFAGQKANNGQQ